LNEVFLRVEKPGILFGQCSEICGINHAFMPIMLNIEEPKFFEQYCFGPMAFNFNNDDTLQIEEAIIRMQYFDNFFDYTPFPESHLLEGCMQRDSSYIMTE